MGVSNVIDDLLNGAKNGMKKGFLNLDSIEQGAFKMLEGNKAVNVNKKALIGQLEQAAANPSVFGGDATTKSMQAIRNTIKEELAPQLKNGHFGENIELGPGMSRILSSQSSSAELMRGLGYSFDTLNGSKSLIGRAENSLAQNAGAFWGNGIYNSVQNYKALGVNEKGVSGVIDSIKRGHSDTMGLNPVAVAGSASSALIAGRVARGTVTDRYGDFNVPGVPFI